MTSLHERIYLIRSLRDTSAGWDSIRIPLAVIDIHDAGIWQSKEQLSLVLARMDKLDDLCSRVTVLESQLDRLDK